MGTIACMDTQLFRVGSPRSTSLNDTGLFTQMANKTGMRNVHCPKGRKLDWAGKQ